MDWRNNIEYWNSSPSPFAVALIRCQSFILYSHPTIRHLQKKIGSELKQQRMGRKQNQGPSNQRIPHSHSRSKSSPEIHVLLDTSDGAIDPYFSEMKRKLPRIKGDRE
jgi:hypothetical protein